MNSIKQFVLENYGKDNELYLKAKRTFQKENYVSVGLLQHVMQISYFRARYVLDRMINEEFCEKQMGTYPCRIISYIN